MPHIIVKLWPGRSDEQKIALADKMAEAMTEIMGIPDNNISVSFEEVAKEKWTEEVYNTDILDKESLLYKKPGY
ncbi:MULTISPECIES: tautomerase family protein [Dehalobacter]|jgi:4-oxalocrotonate tautomerase|uniref:4-oxalocrotonate tautomerase n=1 Tax=Dehalobacter restrictus TaxID=55583 RepID=A0A857DJJ6_9FIRM|nr:MULTISPECIES: tautomerase family protein [Dehalobacter]MCG1024304.1 tautomerase family protein [Dehalobacter sp.]OCZ49508.1 4-oxalocrotonate tautomerase [Dehalobacter sp. TeCB1]QHA00881.1 4-oxalocrotonate tautomerase [Dehalobacter restrictus]